MRRLLALAVLALGCAAGPAFLQIGETAGRAICAGLGCPCAAATASPTHATGRVVFVEVRPDGTAGAVRTSP